jgi:hypothetical protein
VAKTDSEHQPNADSNDTADSDSNHKIRHRAASHYEANAILALLFRIHELSSRVWSTSRTTMAAVLFA